MTKVQNGDRNGSEQRLNETNIEYITCTTRFNNTHTTFIIHTTFFNILFPLC